MAIYFDNTKISGGGGSSADLEEYIDEIANKADISYVDIRVPAWTEADEDKFLRIVNNTPTWSTITNAEEVMF